MRIMNNAGQAVASADSDAEAVRWWRTAGLPNDWLEDTGELLADVDRQLALDND